MDWKDCVPLGGRLAHRQWDTGKWAYHDQDAGMSSRPEFPETQKRYIKVWADLIM